MNPLPAGTADLKSKAEIQDIAAMSLFVAGGAVAAAGVVMVFLNRPQAHQLEEDPRQDKNLLGAKNFSVAPILGDGKSGVMTSYAVTF